MITAALFVAGIVNAEGGAATPPPASTATDAAAVSTDTGTPAKKMKKLKNEEIKKAKKTTNNFSFLELVKTGAQMGPFVLDLIKINPQDLNVLKRSSNNL